MKLIGHTIIGECIVIMSKSDYEGLLKPEKMRPNGFKLKLKRKKLGLRLKDVSDATGVSISMLSDIERGTRNPSPELYEKLYGFFSQKERER